MFGGIIIGVLLIIDLGAMLVKTLFVRVCLDDGYKRQEKKSANWIRKVAEHMN